MHAKKKIMGIHFQARQIIPFATVFILLLILNFPVFAHKVYLFAWIEGDTVYTDSYFSGKKKVRGGLIKVFDPSGRKLIEGKTNENGEFSFKIPKKSDLRIVLDASMGHKAEYVLEADEISNIKGITSTAPEKKEVQAPSSSAVQVEMEQIRRMLEDALDSRLKPISKTLAKIQNEKAPGFTEIIGGIGYIFGLMGLILYFKSRKKP